MEWKNFDLLTNPQQMSDNQGFLDLDENIEMNYPFQNQDNIHIYKKYINNSSLDNFPDINDKNNSIFLNNNYPYDFDKSNPDFYKINNLNNDLNIPFISNENEEKNWNKANLDSSHNENKEHSKKNLFKIQSFSSTSKGDSIIYNKNIKSITEDNNDILNNKTLPQKEGKKSKKEKNKKFLENKTQRNCSQEECKDNSDEKTQKQNFENLSKMNKKEIKMLRNRLSAQRSRDRKKKELFELRMITKNLLQENEKLRKESKEKDEKINQLLNLLCQNCKDKIKYNQKDQNDEAINCIVEDNSQLTPGSIIAGKKKFAFLMMGLLAVFSIFGVVMIQNNQNVIRTLKENKNNNIQHEKRVNIPFIIQKDYTLRHRKEMEMIKKIQKNRLKNKNLMIPAEVLHNNSEKYISQINRTYNALNNSSVEFMDNNKNNSTNIDDIGDKVEDIDKNKMKEDI